MSTTIALTFPIPWGKSQYFDNNGDPLAGGFVHFYQRGGSTPKDTWSDIDLSSLNLNPVELDGNGRANIYGTGAYRQVVTDSLGNQIWDEDTGFPDDVIDPAGVLIDLQFFTGSGTWSRATGVTFVVATVVGGGGGGGGSVAGGAIGGAGGGGGGTAIGIFAPNATETITIGAAGSAGTAAGGNGGTGGTSSFGAHCSATGGTGGQGTGAGRNGGPGGLGSGGSLNIRGGPGISIQANGLGGGSGGGAGGNSTYGGGGVGAVNAAGAAGGNYGGGGAGGDEDGSNQAGGAGAAGMIMVAGYA